MSSAMPQRTIKFDRLDPSVFKKMARSGMREDMTTRAAYSSDASIFRRIPRAVIEPKSADDIRDGIEIDRKSTRLNSSHVAISYAVFCLKKKKKINDT